MRRAAFVFCSVSKRLLAGVLPAVFAAERGARRTGEGVVGCVGLPVAATIAVAIVVIVAIVPSAERGSSDRPRGCNGAADDVAGHDTRCGSPTIPLIAPLARQSGVGVAEPFAAIGRVTLHVALVFGESSRSLNLAIAAHAVGLMILCTLRHRRT